MGRLLIIINDKINVCECQVCLSKQFEEKKILFFSAHSKTKAFTKITLTGFLQSVKRKKYQIFKIFGLPNKRN